MTPRQARIDLQTSKPKLFSLVNGLRARHWFACRGKNICAGFFAETRQIRNVIGVRVRQQNQLHVQLVVLRKAHHLPGISSSIEGCDRALRRVPHKVSVNGHSVVIGGELGSAHLPHPVFSINRGGQATYHGPGQLMGYPIIDLRRCGQDLHKYLRWLEQLLIDLLARYDIAAQRRESLTGVWIENRKIASIGVGVRHWITMHGFALNVCGDLSPFDHIVPCGINNVTITSMEKETKRAFTVAEVARAVEKLALDSIVSLRVAPETQVMNA